MLVYSAGLYDNAVVTDAVTRHNQQQENNSGGQKAMTVYPTARDWEIIKNRDKSSRSNSFRNNPNMIELCPILSGPNCGKVRLPNGALIEQKGRRYFVGRTSGMVFSEPGE